MNDLEVLQKAGDILNDPDSHPPELVEQLGAIMSKLRANAANRHACPWDCPTCGPCPDGPQWVYDDQDKRIGWVCYGCLGGEMNDDDQEQPRKRTRYRSIDDPPDDLPPGWTQEQIDTLRDLWGKLLNPPDA